VTKSFSTVCPKCAATSGGDWRQCRGLCPMPMSPHYDRGQVCSTSTKDVEIYRLGETDCTVCMRRMLEKHEVLVDMFRSWLAANTAEPRRALCHECSEVVEVVDGKLVGHHGSSGDGCPENGAFVQIYLHPKVARRIEELQAVLVFGDKR